MSQGEDQPLSRRSPRAGLALAAGVLMILVLAAWADHATGWVAVAFDAVAHQFYEKPLLAAIRRPSQLVLVRVHGGLFLALVAMTAAAAPWLGAHGRLACRLFLVGYAIRAIVWIAGGNVPLVPGDSCHYIEVASSIVRGEGPVKHYVESFFIDYPEIRQGRGVLDDWATPLYAYLLAAAYRLTGVVPGQSIPATVAVAKGVSFVLSLLALPALYGFGRRRFGAEVGLWAMGALAVLPVHAIYAGFALRESLVALMVLFAVWASTEVFWAGSGRRWGWAVAAGVCGGLAILARNTALALTGVAGLYGLLVHGRRHLGPLLVWGVVLVAVIAPWAWATWVRYGEPFYTYTRFFQYTFSWAVHHYQPGRPRASEFYTWANAGAIARVKAKSLLIIAVVSTMVVSLPLVLGFARRLWGPARPEDRQGRDTDRLVAWLAVGMVVGTLVQIADVTQVAQLGRYYLPLFVVALPTAVAGLRDWMGVAVTPRARPWLVAVGIALLWSDPTWADDAAWLVKPYQLHWPALRAAGEWVRRHPEEVPADARIMTWFPWEFRLASQRTTVLLPRNYDPQRILETIRKYRVTHVLWGSFEPPPHVDPESFGPLLEQIRLSVGLDDPAELYRSPGRIDGLPAYYPVRLFRVRGAAP